MKKLFLLIGIFWSLQSFAQIQAPYFKLEKMFFVQPTPEAKEWLDVPETFVVLFPQNITQPGLAKASISNLKVKALHNGKWIAIRLEWSDLTHNKNVETNLASDACAIQFPMKEPEKTSPFMGGKDAAVSILHWKAIWQQDIDVHPQTVKDIHPNTWVDTYRFGIEAAQKVNNPVSVLRPQPVEELMAQGFGTLTTQREQNAFGRGVWKNKTWSVVIVRPLNSGDKNDPVLKVGGKNSMAFAVWDGGSLNVGGRKNYAPWTELLLQEKK